MRKRVIYLFVSILLSIPVDFHAWIVTGQEEDVTSIHANSVIVDSHIDTLMKVVDPDTWLPVTDIGKETNFEVDIPKMQAAGLSVPFFAAFTSGFYDNNPRSISNTLASINALYWIEKNNTDQLEVTSTFTEIQAAIEKGKIAAVPTIEGAYSLEEHNAIELIRQYDDLGITAIGFTWNYSNALGEGADRVYNDPVSTPSGDGLTELGVEVAEEMNRIGMMIDVSHMAERTFWDVMEVSKAPVIATHSGVNALRNHPRNLTDEQLLALAENGGVVGIVFYPQFLTDDREAMVSDIVDHIDYAVNLIGIDHVALGSDYDGAELPNDLKDASELYKITEELIERDYSVKDIKKILGANTLRVLRDVEKAADPDQMNKGKSPTIIPAYEMGEMMDSRTPLFTAKLEQEEGHAIDIASLRIIVDGIPYEPEFNEQSSLVSLQMNDVLKERFHVVTVEAADETGRINRETRIVWME
ncbi:dipeptidase [Virgibacillus sp. C22-A2]|uniref:Dipeptidase n=1 Tax=Virgibacillus tibetensis TaxID=3042313 RepID=A0ABU6KCS8_9BACI|nr:dipeptidase [Virgibacillus sp. C22-A2]